MNAPTITTTRHVAPDVDQIGTYLALPGMGHLAVNAFLLRSEQPVLIDAGIANMHEPLLQAVESLIDPAELRYIYLTHVDGDHLGCLDELLERAPKARIVTTFLGMSKLGFTRQIPPERFLLLNPGQELPVGDRTLQVHKPPVFDAPETTMLFDPSSHTLFSSDCFGGMVPAPVASANEVPEAALCEGMVGFLCVDSPWVHSVDAKLFEDAVSSLLQLAPETVLSSHLAPATGLVQLLSENLLRAPGATPFSGPDQAAFENMLSAAQ